MNYSTVCSGIEALSVAVDGMDWNAQWFSEIEPFPCRVLKHHYPHVPNLGNMLKIENNETFKKSSIDLLCGGTPCQSFSVAGLRNGLADERGNLALEFCRILAIKKPRWFWWENVPGALSSTGGNDFAAILTAFRSVGYSCAWRILDAQYFGVPQRRRRIFVVGYIGNDWRPPTAVLFERESLFRNIKPSRKTGKEIAGTLDASTKGGGFPGSDGAANGHVVPYIADPLTKRPYSDRGSDGNLITGTWWDGGQTAQTLDAVLHKGQTMPEKNRFPAILCYPLQQISSPSNRSNPHEGDPAPSLTGAGQTLLIPQVRRITPLEAERLQGFPDYYTNIPGAKDSPRYKAIGNSMAVPVMRWIAKRMEIVDKIFLK